ncbi:MULTISPECIES: hypothetical protein [Shewanella]|jgi:hypothetical protein|uniref:Aromatic-ring opening dioxygenase LigAB LigA subunit n=1 Tax=Shewanella fodinae TaxID=552357 RepID=A0A4V2RSA8_9GAMM|nr:MULTISPECIES: hypothetical protein [Shewanella]MDN5369272.1 hypothetical protein [Shewanella sp.]MBO1273390.1 hypothetical protein [Shewanella sp. 4t3-1-2LB]MCD8475902.1 hypothetical protein [Shewanella fodinae]MCL2908279.1 hypothetical protein [Shewanella fodinae]TCN83915.1 hypothetical protein EDC91_1137 [Shewanella fodinae]
MEALQIFLTRMGEDAGFRAAFYADPESVLAQSGLQEQHAEAVQQHDGAALKALIGDDSVPFLIVNHGNKL